MSISGTLTKVPLDVFGCQNFDNIRFDHCAQENATFSEQNKCTPVCQTS